MDVWKALAAPFEPRELEWRISQKTKDKKKALVLPYLTARAIMDRLDAAVGPNGWRDEYRVVGSPVIVPEHEKEGWQGKTTKVPPKVAGIGYVCRLTIKVPRDGSPIPDEVTREDGCDPTDIEPVKGAISGALKRAAVKFGIGRYLYGLPKFWVPLKNEYGDFDPPTNLPKWALPDENPTKLDPENRYNLVDDDKQPDLSKKPGGGYLFSQFLEDIGKATLEMQLTELAAQINEAVSGGKLTENERQNLLKAWKLRKGALAQ